VTPFKGPRNLQTSEPTKTSFRVTWDHAPGDVKGYKVTFHPVGDGIDLGELQVGPYDNTVVLEELRCVFRVTSHFHPHCHISFEEYSLVYHVKKKVMKIIVFLVYRAGTKYSVNVYGMFDGGESMPLAGQEKTTLSDDPEPPTVPLSGKMIFYLYSIILLPIPYYLNFYDENSLYH